MNDVKFKTQSDLYKRIFPALRSKAHEMHQKGFKYIHEEDIWNFLKLKKWTQAHNLDLGSIVNDIFNINEAELDDFVREEIKKYHRKVKENEN